jgi:hypothetical protein
MTRGTTCQTTHRPKTSDVSFRNFCPKRGRWQRDDEIFCCVVTRLLTNVPVCTCQDIDLSQIRFKMTMIPTSRLQHNFACYFMGYYSSCSYRCASGFQLEASQLNLPDRLNFIRRSLLCGYSVRRLILQLSNRFWYMCIQAAMAHKLARESSYRTWTKCRLLHFLLLLALLLTDSNKII